MANKKTQAEWEKDVDELVGDEYTFLDTYQGNTIKLGIVHNVCGYKYSIAPKFFLKGNRCRKCAVKKTIEKNTHTKEQFAERVKDKFKGEYEVVGEYKNTNTKVTVKHTLCGTEYNIRPDSLLRGSQCLKCLHERYSTDNTKTTEMFAKEVIEETKGEYELIGEYVDVNTKVKLKHIGCAKEYEVFPYQFVRGRRCPNCSKSKGERFIEDVLTEHSVNFESQKEFTSLKDVNNLSYDFFLPRYNVLIEYQGVQHFRPVELFGGAEQFIVQQKHDELKRKYAKEHNYMLIEVPYTADSYSKVKDFLIKNINL